MIALDREIPKNCIECPCLYTLLLKDEACKKEKWIRACAAYGMERIYEEWYLGTNVSEMWLNFSKPDWCPWIEIDTK